MKRFGLTFYLLLLILFVGLTVQVSAEEELVDDKTVEKTQQENIERQLDVIKASIRSTNKELSTVDKKIQLAKNETARKKLQAKKEKLLEKLDGLNLQFEAAITGGVRISDYEKTEEKVPFDWQSEVLEIFKPMIAELKTLTEDARAIDALRSEIAVIEEQMPVAQKAVERIALVKDQNKDAVSSELLLKVENDWKNRLAELRNQLTLLNFQLEEKLNPPDAKPTSVSEKLIVFFKGRGLTIILALSAFIVFFLSFAFMGRIVENQITQKKENQAQFFRRALRIVLKFLTILFSLSAAMLVLYVRGDWLILGLILLVLLGVAWGLRTSAPNYIREIKLLLNMGPVRESERVIYNGLPWKVSSLNMYSTLTNPALTGGSVKLPVDDIVGLRSREYSEEEGWFPCMPGDYVILDDGIFGPVLKQTPEIVQMTVLGGSIKTYSTGDFLALNPRNISKGFGVFVTFGLDYDLQSEMTQQIPQKLESMLKAEIENCSFSSHLKSLSVEFKAASASSLDLLIVTIFNGTAAGDYFAIERFIQKTSVNICTNNQWNIPFDNMTVHLDKVD